MPNRIIVDIEDRSGVKQGPGPIATVISLTYGDALNRAAEFAFTMPARASGASLLGIRSSVVRIFDGGSQVFLGIVERLTRTVDDSGVVILTVSGRNMLAELAEVVLRPKTISLAGTYIDGTNGPVAVLNEVGGGWALDTSPPAPLTGYGGTLNTMRGYIGGVSALGGLVHISQIVGENFVYSADIDRAVVWLQDNIPTSGFRAVAGGADPVGLAANENVCVIQSLEQVTDGEEIADTAVPFGGGIGGDSMLDMSMSSYTTGYYGAYYVDRASNSINKGLLVAGRYTSKYLSFPSIVPKSNTAADAQAAANAVVEAAMRWLDLHSSVQYFYNITVLGLPASIRPGENIRVIYSDSALNVDNNLTILEIERRVDVDGARTARLLVGSAARYPTSDSSAVVDGQVISSLFMTTSQAVRTYYEMGPIAENFDNDAGLGSRPAYFHFDLGSAIQQVQEVVFKYKIDLFRSTIKSVTNGALTINNTALGNSGANTTFHTHTVSVTDSTAGSVVWYSGNTIRTAGGGSITTNSDSPSHVHYPPSAHNHTGSSAVTAAAGILEQGPLASPTITINGSSPTNAATGPDANGFYSLDLTPDVSSTTTFRPTQAANVVQVSAAVGYYGLLRARLQVRAFV